VRAADRVVVIALLWTIPVPASFARPGAWAVLVMVLAFYWYWKHSRRLAAALLIAFAVLGLLTNFLFVELGAPRCAGWPSASSSSPGSASSSGTSSRDVDQASSPTCRIC
jgi:di/tricarboxylate transporter